MNDSVYIKRRAKEDNLYNQLQEESLEMIQQLSGKRWTDFNGHDPGITILDILNYALQELDYLFETPFEEFLADPEKRELVYRKAGLLPPQEIFQKVIITPADYEELFCSLPGVKDCRVQPGDYSLYTILIEKEEDAEEGEVGKRVIACYHAHRNLCENMDKVCFGSITEKANRETSPKDRLHTTSLPLCKPVTPNGFIYHTIQNEFPECYGIGERGLPADASVIRKAEALQLKGFLLIFDYLLSGISQQVKHIPSLLELSGKLPEQFRAEMDIPDISKLLSKEKLRHSIIFDPEEIKKQKTRFFDRLDTLYGEDTRQYAAAKSLAFRATLIERFPIFNTLRFRSFDLLDRELKSMPGIKYLIYTLLENEAEQEMSVINNFSRYNLNLVTDEKFFGGLQEQYSIKFFLGDYTEIPKQYEISEIPRISIRHSLHKFYRLRNHLNLFRNQILFEGFLKNGMNPDNFRSIWLPDKTGYLLLYKHPGQKDWINLGFFFDRQLLIETCNHLWAFIERLNRESFSFYFIEHILLLENEQAPSPETSKLTILITGWVDHYYPRETYLRIFEERLPVHLEVNYLWLGVEEMKEFEEYYFKWRSAWAHNDEPRIIRYSKELKRIIN